MYGMLLGAAPFHAEYEDKLFDIILQEPVFFPPNLDSSAKKMIRGLL